MAVDSPDIRPILLPKLYRSREEVAHVRFQPPAERAVIPCRQHPPIPADARVEAVARQSRITGTGRRTLRQRGGDRRRRLSLSRDLPRQGFAGLLLASDRAVCALP